MKKLICVLLAVSVAVCLSVCCADEIRFRGFEWGVGIDELEREMEKLGYMADSIEGYMPYWGDCENQLNNYMSDERTSEKAGWMGVAVELGNPISVAGYNVSTILLYCAYEVGGNGGVLRDRQESKFYQAQYELTVADANGAYSDLKGKLSALYGECIEFSKVTHGGEAVEKLAEWRGENNTAVRLYGQMRNPDVKDSDVWECIDIYYGKVDEDVHLGIVEEMVLQERKAAESALYGNSDTSGL